MRLCHQRPTPNISAARSRISTLACRSPTPGAIRPHVSTSANNSAALALASSSRATRVSSSSTSSATTRTLGGGTDPHHWSVREPVGLIADRHPAPLGELVPAAIQRPSSRRKSDDRYHQRPHTTVVTCLGQPTTPNRDAQP